MADSVTDRPTHWWLDPDGDGHNCDFCDPESIWKCDERAHPKPTAAEEHFTRLVVQGIDHYENDLTPEQKVGAAYRIVGSVVPGENIALTEENALYLAATIVLAGSPSAALDADQNSDGKGSKS